MNAQDRKAFDDHIENVGKGRGMLINRLDLHELTWEAALEYDRNKVEFDWNLYHNDDYKLRFERECEKSKKLIEALEEIVLEVGTSTRTNKIANEALKGYRGEL